MGFFSGLSSSVGKIAGIAGPALAGYATGGLYGGLSSSLTALGGISGQMDVNAANSAQAMRAMEFNAKQARIQRRFTGTQAQNQMAFQRQMSNTAHFRQIRDLKRAGLNPILSATSGASSPGGAMGGGAPPSGGVQATMQNEILPAISTALDLLQTTASTQKTLADAKLSEAQLPKESAKADIFTQAGKGTSSLNAIFDWFSSRVPTSAKDLERLYDDYKWQFREWYKKGNRLTIPISHKNALPHGAPH